MNCLLLALSTAILNFQTPATPELNGRGEEAAILLQAHLSSNENVTLVERAELEKLLSEQGLGLSGTVLPETAAKIGQLTGAKVLVTGRLFQAGPQYFLVAKVMSTETSRVFGETTQFGNLANLSAATTELADKVGKLITEREKDLVAPKDDRPDRIAVLKKSLEGRKLPTVSVSIKEEHLPRPVIDPAAQTKMQNLLQELGFEIIDPQQPNAKADIMITGEAFSEMGQRNANLISCRARVEIKVLKNGSDTLILADSEASPGVDLSEGVAAKKALEEAAFRLTERVVPKITQP